MKVLENLKNTFSAYRKRIMNNKYLAFTLAFVGGMLEVYSLAYRGFFSLMHTGNIITVFTSLISEQYVEVLQRLVVVFSFIIGLIIANFIEYHHIKRNKNYHVFELILMAICLIISILIPTYLKFDEKLITPDNSNYINVIGNIFMAIIGATLLQSFNKIEDRNVTTTMLTANLQRTVSSFFKGVKKEDKKEVVAGINYVFVVISFIIGAATSYLYLYLIKQVLIENCGLFYQYLPNFILFVPLIITIILVIRYKIKDKKTKKSFESD